MIGWWDCAAGASGDMMLGALVDVGVPLGVMQSAVDRLGVEPIRLDPRPVWRHGIGGTQVTVHSATENPKDASDSIRTWSDIRAVLTTAELTEPVRSAALDVFGRMARAEAAVHRVSPEEVRFHEVGAVDALADVVGACAGLHHLGLASVAASPVALGTGAARSMHGVVPVPAPAVLDLLAEVRAPVLAGSAPHEMCTPTGAALLAAHVSSWGGLPPMTVRRTGYGAGSRDLAELPNVLRLVLGDPGPAKEEGAATAVAARERPPSGPEPGEALVLEANVDDLDPRLWPSVFVALRAAGATDAWLSPIVMKKGRPAHTLHVLARPDEADAVRLAIFHHTSTIGIRQLRIEKYALRRSMTRVDLEGHPVGVKQAWVAGAVVNASVEYEDVVVAATALGIPVKVALARATALADQSGLLP